MTIALAFPGQGCQRPGMGRDFHARFAEARAAFEEASDAIAVDVAALCFADDARLQATEYQQPAILTVEIAAQRALARHFGLEATWFGGHSLGEYAALVAAGVLDLGAAARLVRERGRLMQSAAPAEPAAMTAVILPDLDRTALAELVADLDVDVANHNATSQCVLAGTARALAAAGERLKASAAFRRARLLPLRVSAPFHSRWMRPVAAPLGALLAESARAWNVAAAPFVTSNVSGAFHTAERETLVAALTAQVSTPVRWVDNMRALVARATRVVEVGPGRPLRAFFGSIGAEIESVTDLESAEALATGD